MYEWKKKTTVSLADLVADRRNKLTIDQATPTAAITDIDQATTPPQQLETLTVGDECTRDRKRSLEIISAIDAGEEPAGASIPLNAKEVEEQENWKKEFDKKFGVYAEKYSALDGIDRAADDNIDDYKTKQISLQLYEARRFVIYYRRIYFKEKF